MCQRKSRVCSMTSNIITTAARDPPKGHGAIKSHCTTSGARGITSKPCQRNPTASIRSLYRDRRRHRYQTRHWTEKQSEVLQASGGVIVSRCRQVSLKVVQHGIFLCRSDGCQKRNSIVAV